MRTHLKRATLAATAVAFFAVGAWAAESTSKLDPKKPMKGSAESKAQKGKSTEVKITGDDSKNSTVAASTKRAGPYSCDIHIDNRTDYAIHRVYVDGRNWGSVGRYGDAIARDVGAGRTTLYAEADFTDGSTLYWGPRVFNCDAWGSYTWYVR